MEPQRRSQTAHRFAAAEVATRIKRKQVDDEWRTQAARARLEKPKAGNPVVGRIPGGPNRLAEAQAHLAREIAMRQAKLDRRTAIIAAGKKPLGAPPVPLDQHSRIIRTRAVVAAALTAERQGPPPAASRWNLPKTVANITNPQPRPMPTRRGFLQGYNAQLAVTSDQIIVAVDVAQSPSDIASFLPMMRASQAAADMLHADTGRPEHIIGTVLADAGYASEANLAASAPARLIALKKARDQARASKEEPACGPPPVGSTPRQEMSHRLRSPEGTQLYRRRGATIEPGLGNLKKLLARFSRRGLDSAKSELNLSASAFNLMKIHRAIPA